MQEESERSGSFSAIRRTLRLAAAERKNEKENDATKVLRLFPKGSRCASRRFFIFRKNFTKKRGNENEEKSSV
ncbi:hypothetical protein [Acidaminobacterium chupaoyuni]